ncbi:MAG: hypothetical protein KAH18_05435 [Psychromonas sp.]|nr:hypothetical protein [Psychromonas sp.]
MTNLLNSRAQGIPAEYILVSLLSQIDYVHAVSFDTVGFDIIAWDSLNHTFPCEGPLYIQVKLRMSSTRKSFTSQGHNNGTIYKINHVANTLGVSDPQCYFCKKSDVHTTEYFIISLNQLWLFDNGGAQYRFSHKQCSEFVRSGKVIKI